MSAKRDVMTFSKRTFGCGASYRGIQISLDNFIGRLSQVVISDNDTTSGMKLSTRPVETVQLFGSKRHVPGGTKFLHLLRFA